MKRTEHSYITCGSKSARLTFVSQHHSEVKRSVPCKIKIKQQVDELLSLSRINLDQKNAL